MKSDEFLLTAIKLIGMVTVVYAVIRLVYGFLGIIMVVKIMPDAPHDLLFAQRFYAFMGVVIPLIIGLIGYYFLFKGENVYARIIRSSTLESTSDYRGIFLLSVKLIGLVMVVYSLSPIFSAIAELFYIESLRSTTHATDIHLQRVWNQLIPGVVYFIAGTYFVLGGKKVVELAFPVEEEEQENEKSI